MRWVPWVKLLPSSPFSVVRHAEELAHRFGEPYGTLILTISAISIEVVVIATIMLHGANNPKLARDTMYAVVMIVLAGVVGFSLLWGGFRHHEQGYNRQGASTFLSILIPLSVLSLVWPNFTHSTLPGSSWWLRWCCIGCSWQCRLCVTGTILWCRRKAYLQQP